MRNSKHRRRACEGCEKNGVELKSCGECHAAWYCGRRCQRASWKAHKEVCGNLKAARVNKNSVDKIALKNLPRRALAVPPALTGYPREELILYPAWDFEDKRLPLIATEHARDVDYRASILKSTIYFFKYDGKGRPGLPEIPSATCAPTYVSRSTLASKGYGGR